MSQAVPGRGGEAVVECVGHFGEGEHLLSVIDAVRDGSPLHGRLSRFRGAARRPRTT